MKYKFFENLKTVEELKRQYKTLAFKHQPDRGGKVEDMQRINAEYDELYNFVKNIHETAEGTTYEKKADSADGDIPDRFRDIINAIINFDCVIELCGSWLWVFNGYKAIKRIRFILLFEQKSLGVDEKREKQQIPLIYRGNTEIARLRNH